MKVNLNELLEIKNGMDYKGLRAGDVPVYGSGGYMLSVNKFLYEGESILLPRKGTLNNVMFVSGKFWTVDTMYWSKIDKTIVEPYYLYYLLKSVKYDNLYTGSTLPSMTNQAYYSISLDVHPMEEQKRIAFFLKSIDFKINLNNKINEELEKLAQELYEYWFVQFDFPDENNRPISYRIFAQIDTSRQDEVQYA